MLTEWLEQGLLHHRAGRIIEAKDIYNQILTEDPRHPDALHLLGLIALQSGEADTAADMIRRAIAVQPRNWGYWANLGRALIELQRFDDAFAALQEAAKLNPEEPEVALSLATCLALRGNFAAAETRLRKLARLHPDFVLAWHNLGHAIRDQGRLDEAIACYRRAIRIAPESADAHNDLAAALHKKGRFEDAEQEFQRAVALRPESAIFHGNLASVLIDRGKFAEAEVSGGQAIALAPHAAEGYTMMASAMSHQGRLLHAIDFHRKAAELEPHNARSLAAYGAALKEIGRAAEGIAVLERALSLAPDASEIRAHLATALLALGDFDRGWREYVQRPPRVNFVRLYPHVRLSTELTRDALAHKQVCVLREQGLGDQIFFLRYVHALKACGARVTYRSTPKIASLLRRVAPIDELILDSEPIPAADYTMLAGDLPLIAASLNEASTGAAPSQAKVAPPLMLTPLPEALASMRQRLNQLGPPPYLGVTWRAGVMPEEQSALWWQLFKQIKVQQLARALLGVPATLLALQRKPAPGEIEVFAAAVKRPLHDLTALNDDLESMLALLAVIDDYVGVSNTNMHLRAGVGKTARVLVPCPAEWRWMAKGDESPWFTGFRIYRQSPDGDWHTALARLAQDLHAAFGAGDDGEAHPITTDGAAS